MRITLWHSPLIALLLGGFCLSPSVSAQTNVLRALPISRPVHPGRAAAPGLAVTNGPTGPQGVRLISTLQRKLRLTGTGAKADFGRLRASFESDIAAPRPVTVVTPDGRTLKFRPTYLVLENRATGQSLLLGEVTNRIGEVILPDTLRWTNVFGRGPSVTLELRYSGESLEQNVVISESLDGFIPPAWAGQLSDLSLEFWTEWSDSTPSATETRRITLRPAAGSSSAVQADDATVSFGHARVVAGGRAFSIGADSGSLPVSKSWVQVPVEGGTPRIFLIETLDLLAAKPQLDALPATGRHASLQPKSSRSEMLRAEAAKGNSQRAALQGRPAFDEPGRQSLLITKSEPAAQGFLIDFQLINTVPVPAGVISWWPGGCDALDATANHNNGTLEKAAGFAAGEVGQGFRFDDSNYVAISDAPSLNPTNGMTFEGWVYLDHLEWNQSIFRKDGECSSRQFLLTVSPSHTFRAHVGSTNGIYYYIDSTNTVATHTWYYVAMTYDVASSNLSLYVNGELNSSGMAVGAIIQTPQTLYIGGGPNPCSEYDFSGIIDEPTFYDRALSAAEIAAIYGAGAAGKINPNCVAPSTNAVGWWPGDGNAFDIARTNNGALENGAAFTPGVVGDAFSLDGYSAHVRVADNPAFHVTNAITVEAWIYPTSVDSPQCIIDKWDYVYGAGQKSYDFSLSSGGQFYLLVSSDGFDSGNAYITSSNAVPVNGWSHVAGVYDGTFLKVYLNGVLDAEASYSSGIYPGTNDLGLGGLCGGAPPGDVISQFSGMIDEPTLYNRALSAGEIAAIYSGGCAGKCKADADNDGLSDLQEAFFGTNPNAADSDRDGLSDWDEIFKCHLNPLREDSDGDGVIDQPFKVVISQPVNTNP